MPLYGLLYPRLPANITLPLTSGLTSVVTSSSDRVSPARFLFSSHKSASRTSIPPYTGQQVLFIYDIRMLS